MLQQPQYILGEDGIQYFMQNFYSCTAVDPEDGADTPKNMYTRGSTIGVTV